MLRILSYTKQGWQLQEGEVDAASLGWLGVMALLAAAVHGERHNCGTLSAIYEDGSLLKWLLLLKKFDEQM